MEEETNKLLLQCEYELDVEKTKNIKELRKLEEQHKKDRSAAAEKLRLATKRFEEENNRRKRESAAHKRLLENETDKAINNFLDEEKRKEASCQY